MKVIIIGGGIAGLTFANALEKGGVDFLLLESRPLLDPQVGASIGVWSGPLRIMDQFGATKEILRHTYPLQQSRFQTQDGKLISPPSQILRQIEPRHGYGSCFLDRQLVLRALANSIENQDRLLLKKKLKTIDHRESGVTVHCEDGSSYDGDIVVGCDGVHSKTREEMWRIAALEDPTYFRPAEKTKMTTEFRCLFGISHHVPGFDTQGTLDVTVSNGSSFLIVTGKDCRLYWFFFQKLDRVYRYGEPDFPKYSKLDAENVAESNGFRKCSENVTLADVWEKRISYTLVPMEECLYEQWSWGRIATIGDNAHKMTANHGQAGNNAVESAAALANQIKRLHEDGVTDISSITSAFSDWRERRRPRIAATVKEAADVCRMQSLDGIKWYIMVFCIMRIPAFRDAIVDRRIDTTIGGEILEYLPIPERSLDISVPYNQAQGIGRQKSLLGRALRASPLLLVAYLAARDPGGDSHAENLLPILQPTKVTSADWWQAFSFAVSKILLYSIWLMESQRLGNQINLIRFHSIFGVLSGVFGFGVIGPIWMFFHYVYGGVEKYAAGDRRLTKLAYIKTVLPVSLILLLFAVAPKLTDFDFDVSQQTAGKIWVWMPLGVAVIQGLLVESGLLKDTSFEDGLKNWTIDYPTISTTIRILAIFSSLTAIGRWFVHGTAPSEFFLFLSSPLSNLDRNCLAVGIASAIWSILLFRDLEVAGMLSLPAWKWTLLVASLPFVPLTTLASGCWVTREKMLVEKKEKHAITKDKYLGKSVLEVEGGMAIHGGAVNRLRKEKQENGEMNAIANGYANGRAKEHMIGYANGDVYDHLNGHTNEHADGSLNGQAK